MDLYHLERFIQNAFVYGAAPLFVLLAILLQIFLIVGLIIIIRKLSIIKRVIRQGGICAEGVSVPAEEYFARMKESLSYHKIEGLSISYRTLPETSPIMSYRKYLRVKKQGVMFYICTFNVGNTQSFTYWQIEPLAFFRRVFRSIPIIGPFFLPETLYRVDLASTLMTIIEGDIKAVTAEMGVDKGVRIEPTNFKDFRRTYGLI